MNDVMPVALIVVGVLAAIVAALIALSRKEARAKRAMMRDAFKVVLSQNNLAPDHLDEFQHRIIGMDSAQRVFVAIQHEGTAMPHEVIALSDVADCTIRKSGHMVSAAHKNEFQSVADHTDGIALSFMLRSGGAIDIPVYSEKLDGLTERIYLHQTAEKWQQRIRTAIGKTG